MDIITAEQARDITNSYIPYDISMAVEHTMEKIKEAAECGSNNVEFCDGLTPCAILETIKTDKFKAYIESFGYTYELETISRAWFYSERVIISW